MARRAAKRGRIARIGGLLILAGVSVWVVYGIVWLAGGDPRVGYYLPFHLAGVLPGAVLTRWPTRGTPEEQG